MRRTSTYKEWLEAEAEHREPEVTNTDPVEHESGTVHISTGQEWSNWLLLKVDKRVRKTKEAGLDLQWCSVRSEDVPKKVETFPRESDGLL